MAEILDELVGRLKKSYQERLVSAILYGSAAVGDHHGKYSDLNILCVLREITTRELAESQPIFRWWREQNNPAPLLLSLHEVRTATDCFPIEFHDIRERRRVLHGEDVVADLEIDDVFYRAQVEHELRAKLIRLRQKAGGVLSDNDLLLRLMLDSVSTFCVLIRHTLLLAGHDGKMQKREMIEEAQAAFGLDAGPFRTLLDIREAKTKPKSLDTLQLFENYLKQIHVAVDVVDRMER
ncbi:MAG: nucleotidyltransferase domain-containing protein [Acidobacteria bacterium]|nr:nucleotidyltransferase domain-containing protein [Acidobacteriota bacterium]